MNVSKLITLALKQLGVVASGENASADEVADALDMLQGLLAQWATSRLYVYKVNEIVLILDKGAGTYLIGKIEGDCCEHEVTCCGSVLDQPDLNAEIMAVSDHAWLDDEQITMIRDLNSSKQAAEVRYQQDSPNWKFDVLKSGKTLKFNAYTLSTDLCAHDSLRVPPNYERPLILSLALEIAPMFGVEPSMLLIRNQANAIDLLKRSNSTPCYAKNDLPVGVRYGCY